MQFSAEKRSTSSYFNLKKMCLLCSEPAREELEKTKKYRSNERSTEDVTHVTKRVCNNKYKWLDATFVGTSPKIIVKKLLLDQFVLSPVLLVIFYISMSIMERKSDVLEEFRQKFITTFKTSCGFWIPAQSINFMFVPPIARVAYVGTCSFIWINILCWLKRTKVEPDEKSI